jgi:hypothetical protein
MKTKVIILLVISAVITLSFTVVSVNNKESNAENVVKMPTSEPVGGFISEDKL